REAELRIRDIANLDARLRMVGKPAHMPLAEVVGPGDPPRPIAPIKDGEIALKFAVLAEHRRKPDAARAGQFRGHEPVEPLARLRPGHLVARKGGDIEEA